MTAAFDPAVLGISIFVHPTRQQFEEGFRHQPSLMRLKGKLMKAGGYPVSWDNRPGSCCHHTVVVRGVNGLPTGPLLTAMRLFCESPVGFVGAATQTFHVVRCGGRPLIGLIAADIPLDRDNALAHFPLDGDGPHGAV